MKNKILKAVALSIISTFISSKGAMAFYSQTHFEIAKQTVSNSNLVLEPDLRKIYQSAAFLADIGRCTWDDLYKIDSDSEIFEKAMSKICKENFENQVFSLGWKHHVKQDIQGSAVQNIFGKGEYKICCGRLENYFDKFGNKMILRGGDSFYINCELIRKAYEDTCNFSPSDKQIYTELNKMFIAVNLVSYITQKYPEMAEAEVQNFKSEINRLAEICLKDFEGLDKPENINSIKETLSDSEIIPVDGNNEDKLSVIANKFYKIAHFEKIACYGNFDEVKYVIEDLEKYNAMIEEIVSLMGEK